MKKLFKLIPVALAAFALASCSSDDLNIANGENELTYSPDQLMVQIEGDESEETTRGGYVTNIYDYKIYSAMAFDLGETLKIYHDATSWKPEIWTANAYGQYKNATGIAVFKKVGSTITTEEDAYGIYPSTASVFGNENRTSIQYDLSDMAFVNYSVDAGKTYQGGTTGEGAITKYYQAEFPLWGAKAAGANVMTFKHLAGILRLDIANVGVLPVPVAPGADPQYKYIIIRSNTKKLTGVINTAADLLNPTPAEELTPANFMSNTPALKVENAAHTAALAATPITEATAEAADNVIVIRIDANTTDSHVMAFVPILPEMAAGDVDVYVTPVLTPGAATTIDLSAAANIQYHYSLTADIINDCNNAYTIGGTKPYAGANTVKRGVTYKINDDSTNKNETAKTPFQLAEGIIAADKAAYRDFDVYFTQPIEVKNNDDSPQNFMLNLAGGDDRYGLAAGWELKHNVTVHMTLKESDDAGAVPSVLYIKTMGGKKLTLEITNGGTAVDSIVVMKDGLQNDGLVLKTAAAATRLPNIHVYQGNNDKVTILSGVDGTIKLNSNATFNIPVFGATNEVNELVLAKGVTKVTTKSGDIKTINLAAGADAIGADVEIYSEGKVSISAVNFANMPKTGDGSYTDTYNLKFVSKFVEGATGASYATTSFDGAATKYITTADQLSRVVAGTGDVSVIGEYNLDGPTSTWTSLAGLTQSISGAQYYRHSNTATRGIVGNTTIKNLKGANGLIAAWTPAVGACISNITFDGGSTVDGGAAVTTGTALLVGSVTSTNAGVIKNIKVQGTNTVTTSGNSAAVAAVIGKTTGASDLKLFNVNVAAGTSVTSFKYVGGIIGEVAGKVVFGVQSADGATDKVNDDAYAGNDVQNSSAASLYTYRISTTAPCSSVLPTKGQFFGGASAIAADGDVKIIGQLSQLNTALTNNLWGYYVATVDGEYYSWPISLLYNEIGHCGFSTAANAVTVDAAIHDIKMYTTDNANNPTYGTTTTLGRYVGKNIAGAGHWQEAKNAQAIGGTMYFDYVENPLP